LEKLSVTANERERKREKERKEREEREEREERMQTKWFFFTLATDKHAWKKASGVNNWSKYYLH